ncbi:MAG: Type III restriction-modification enzyme helicase subunit, partial [uncultured Chloroflexia bacterium]
MSENGSFVPYDKDLPEVPGRQGTAHLLPTSYLRKTAEGGFEVVPGRRPSKLLLVNRLRKAVDAWRDGGYSGGSEVTRRLFRYWFDDEHSLPGGVTFRYYFGQREAIETLAYLVEVAEVGDAKRLVEEFGEVFYPEGSQRRFREEDIFHETNAATGRRRIRRYVPEHGVESEIVQDLPIENLWRLAFKAATGSGKTVTMALVVVWSYFHKRMVLGSPLSANFLVVAPNVIVYQRLEQDFADGTVFHKLPLIPPEWRGEWALRVILRKEETEPAGASGSLFLTNVQQIHRRDREEMSPENAVQALLGPAVPAAARSGGRTMVERLEDLPDLVVLNDEAHHVHDEELRWNQVLARLHERLPGGLSLWLDLSATPKDQNGTYFPWVVSDFPLAQAVEDRIVKAPLIVHRVEREDPRHNVTAANAVETYADWVRAAVARFREHERIYEPMGQKPVLFVMAEKSVHADAIGGWLAGEEELGFSEDEVLVIHTNTRGEVNDADLTKARKAVREIDAPDNPIKAVISVLMLREGWDVRNVTVVLGLRPFSSNANILPEQAVGRGLRLMGGLGPDRTQ